MERPGGIMDEGVHMLDENKGKLVGLRRLGSRPCDKAIPARSEPSIASRRPPVPAIAPPQSLERLIPSSHVFSGASPVGSPAAAVMDHEACSSGVYGYARRASITPILTAPLSRPSSPRSYPFASLTNPLFLDLHLATSVPPNPLPFPPLNLPLPFPCPAHVVL
ncbi:hypothetical protein BHM03_00037486 [Ensete ventricosum]|nr:hypothetical protein BHM03_00037486 [Ensete ventricosum]